MKTVLLLYYEDKRREDPLNEKEIVGDYFVRCADHIKGYLAENHPTVTVTEIKNNSCNQLNLETKLSHVNGEEFLFAALCHGLKDSFIGPNRTPLIKAKENDHFLENGFVFSNSCFSGAELGPALIEKKACLFVGFNDISWIYPDYSHFFTDCDNYPVLLFFMRGRFLKDEKTGLEKMIKDFYNQKIDELYKQNYLAASRLMHNRDCLVLYFR